MWLRERTVLRRTGKHHSKGTAEELKRRSVITVFIITVFLGVLIPGFVN